MRRARLCVAMAALAAIALMARAPRLSAQQTNADGVGLRASLSADTVYVGEQMTYTLSVRIPTAVRQRLRRNPEFVPPEPRSMLAYDLPLSRVGEPGDSYETHTFRRALFVLTPGRYSLGSARLSYSLPQSSSFFSREDDRTLRAEGLSFVAVEPPLRGRPADWSGAVGEWRASLRAEPTSTRVGDPFVLVLRVEGTGNATLLPRPPLAIAWADVVPQDERVTLDSTPALFGGVKEFTWLVTPREPGARSVPPISYATFNPSRRAYERIGTQALQVNVRPGSLAEVPLRGSAQVADSALDIRPLLEGPTMLRLPGQLWWAWLALLAPLPYVLLRVAPALRRTREKRVETPRSARALLDAGLRARTGVDPAALTAPGALAAALRLEGVTPDTADAVEALRDTCDRESYARGRLSGSHPAASPSAGAGLRARATAVLAKVDAEARRRALLLLLALGALGGCYDGSGNVDALQAFTEGRTAYAGGDYIRARDAFQRSTALAPRDAAAWANLGSAAWQARDTARAVLGWQRALRLDPSAAELRDRLARVPAPQHQGAGQVWPLSPLPIAALGLALWLAGWAIAARHAKHRHRSRWPLAAILPGAALIAAAAWHDSRLAARDLVVVHEPSPLRALPALGAEGGAQPMTGEVARVLERRGVWLRLELDGGRNGWFPAERTWPLARD